MPIYKYKCKSCGSEQEEYRMISKRDDDGECEECGKICSRVTEFGTSLTIFWKYAGDTRPTTQPPSNKNKYTVGDVAKEKGWFDKK